MDAAWARGMGASFDTASSYGGGRSETDDRRMAPRSCRPDGLALTSKAFHPVHEGDDFGLAHTSVVLFTKASSVSASSESTSTSSTK